MTILLLILGLLLPVGQVHSWLGFLLLCITIWVKLSQEEKLMDRHFPDQYPAYKSQVKALVPFFI